MSTLLEIFKTMEYGPAPESPDAVKAWLDEHKRKFGLFINNEWVTPKGAKYYPSYDPSNGELLGETVQAGKKEVDAAVAAAREAFGTWSKTPGVVRARYMYAIARNIQKHLVCWQCLKAWTTASRSVSRGISMCRCWRVTFIIMQVGRS